VYVALKHLHMASAAVSLALFLVRGAWMLTGSRLLYTRFSRIVPHVVDTLLLATAIGLMIVLRQYPFAQDWLTAKLVGLVVYIFLGTIALKRGKTPAIRSAALVAALMVFGWIVMTARAHAPWLISG
jgi:uncharacterized membrane protein SirB2